MSVAERTSKPEEIARAIRCMLQTGNASSSQWAVNLNARLHDAIWYEVDVDKVIGAALAQMKSSDLNALNTTCARDESLAWLAKKLEERQTASTILKKQLEHAVEKSMALSMDGLPIRGAKQIALWGEAEQFFALSFGCNLEESVRNVIEYAIISKLLPLAENYLGGEIENSNLLNEFCKQAFARIKACKTITWNSLSDRELDMFSKLVKHDELKHLASALKKEIERREHIAKRHEVASSYATRLSELSGNAEPGQKVQINASARLPWPKFRKSEITDIVAGVIARAAPETVLKVAELTNTSLKDKRLIDAAKEQLNKPKVKLLEQARLIAYLKLPEGSVSASARELLQEEAKNRAGKAGLASMEILMEGIKSGSYRKLVGAVLEFVKLDKMKADLQEAADVDIPPGSETLTAFFSNLDKDKILDLQHLAIQLKAYGQTEIANRLNSFIHRLGRQQYLPPSNREKQAIKEAVSNFFPDAGAGNSRLTMTAVDEELKEKYFSELLKSHYDENLVRRERSDSGELPVCSQFVKDQRNRVVRVASRPIDGHAIFNETSANVRRTREFVSVMRGENFTDAQIMMASRIACQNSANLLFMLIAKGQTCALTDIERKQCGDAAKKIGNAGMIPEGLAFEANVVRNPDGNMTVHLQIFQENAKTWHGILPEDTISTDPLTSSFLSKMTFVVDATGEFLPQETTFEIGYHRDITQDPED